MVAQILAVSKAINSEISSILYGLHPLTITLERSKRGNAVEISAGGIRTVVNLSASPGEALLQALDPWLTGLPLFWNIGVHLSIKQKKLHAVYCYYLLCVLSAALRNVENDSRLELKVMSPVFRESMVAPVPLQTIISLVIHSPAPRWARKLGRQDTRPQQLLEVFKKYMTAKELADAFISLQRSAGVTVRGALTFGRVLSQVRPNLFASVSALQYRDRMDSEYSGLLLVTSILAQDWVEAIRAEAISRIDAASSTT